MHTLLPSVIKGTQARSHLPEPDHVDGAVAVLTHLAVRAAAEKIEHQAAIDLEEAHAHLTQSGTQSGRNQTSKKLTPT